MRLKYIVLLIIVFVSGTHSVYAQWDAQISQYWKMKNYYNPSFLGETNHVENILLHRQQWVGMPQAPNTSMASINMPLEFLGKTHGVGLLVVNEKVGLFSNTTTAGQYAYKFKFKKNRTLNVGLQVAMINIDFDAAKIHIPGTDGSEQSGQDPSVPSGGEDKAFDAGLGVSWITPKYYVGFAINHLWEPTFDLDDEHSSFIGRGYYLTGGYNIKLWNPLIELQPSALLKSDITTTQLDLTAKVEYNKMFNGGMSWRKDDGFVFLLGVKIKNIDAGYSYDLTTSAISKVSHGSHELFLRYILPLDKKKTMGAHKSVRIL